MPRRRAATSTAESLPPTVKGELQGEGLVLAGATLVGNLTEEGLPDARIEFARGVQPVVKEIQHK